MRMSLAVADQDEADQIRAGLSDPEVRAFVRLVGILNALPSNRARRRVLSFVADGIDEHGASFARHIIEPDGGDES